MGEAGLTSEEAIREREVIRARLESAIDDYTKAKLGNNPPAQEAAVIRMKSICIAHAILNPRPTPGSSTSSDGSSSENFCESLHMNVDAGAGGISLTRALTCRAILALEKCRDI
jgi:hypothetical protein